MPEYIDRASAAKIICAWCGTCPNPTVEDLLKCDDICPEFAQIPAADVRPVVHGEWIHLSKSDKCSVCGYDTGKYEPPTWFCPKCGADMRKEVDDGKEEKEENQPAK